MKIPENKEIKDGEKYLERGEAWRGEGERLVQLQVGLYICTWEAGGAAFE